MEAAGNGDTVTRSSHGIKIDLVFISVDRPRSRKTRDLANDSLCSAVIVCTSRKYDRLIVLIDVDIRSDSIPRLVHLVLFSMF